MQSTLRVTTFLPKTSFSSAHFFAPLSGVVCLGVIVYSYSLRLMKQKQAEIAAAAPGAADAPKETTPLSGAKK